MTKTETVIRLLLERSTPGSKKTIQAHIDRATLMAVAIEQRFSISTPHQWQVKHLIWYFTAQIADRKPTTRYDYWRTCRVVAAALGKWSDWESHLRGNWNPHSRKGQGGRPAKLPGNT